MPASFTSPIPKPPRVRIATTRNTPNATPPATTTSTSAERSKSTRSTSAATAHRQLDHIRQASRRDVDSRQRNEHDLDERPERSVHAAAEVDEGETGEQKRPDPRKPGQEAACGRARRSGTGVTARTVLARSGSPPVGDRLAGER